MDGQPSSARPKLPGKQRRRGTELTQSSTSPAPARTCRVGSAALVRACRRASKARRYHSKPGPAARCRLSTAHLPVESASSSPPHKAGAANDQEFSSGQEPSVSLHVYGEQAGGMGRGVKAPCFSFQASLGASRPHDPPHPMVCRVGAVWVGLLAHLP